MTDATDITHPAYDSQMTWRREIARTLRLALPIVLTQLGWVGMLTTDAAMIGRLGAAPLAGATLVLMIYFMFYVACIGVVTATAALAAQAFGARQPRILRRVIRQGLWVTIALSVPALTLMVAFTNDLLRALDQPAEAVDAARNYMVTLAWSLPFSIAFAVLRNFVAALNRPAVALWVMLFGVPLNALLDYMLIFGNFGAPRWELFGAGIATSAVNLVIFAALLAIAMTRYPFKRYAILGRFWRPDWAIFRQIFKVGTPIAAMMMLESGFFIGAAFIIGLFGTTALAAHMVAIQAPHVTFMIPLGVGQAATVRVGHAVGRGDVAGAYRAGWTAIMIVVAFTAMTSIVLFVFPEIIAGVFLDPAKPSSAAALTLAISLMVYAALFQMADGFQATAAAALRGLNDTTVPMAVAALGYWGLGAAAALTLGFLGGMQAAGVWLGFVVGLSAVAVLLVLRFRALARRGYIPDVSKDPI